MVFRKRLSEWSRPGSGPSELLALIPVFNGAKYLQRSLDSLALAVDGVVALDDGSDDATPDILRSHAAVLRIVTYAPKPLADWNESWTRRVLYEEAAFLSPRWVLCFDADEEIEATFAVFRDALLQQPEAIRGYVFPRVAVHDGKATKPIFLHRMYRYRSGYTFHNKKIHCRSIPLEIELEELRVANIRILHHAGSPEDKQARYARYQVVDPQRKYQASYENLLSIQPSQQLLPLGGSLRLAPVSEDGFQNPLIPQRYFHRHPENTLQAHLERLQRQLAVVATRLAAFNTLRLRAFTLCARDGEAFAARFAFGDDTRRLSRREAFFIESYWTLKDYFDLVARFAVTFDMGLEEAVGQVDATAASLAAKGVLKNGRPAS